ncbi:FadR/GntR family transcriptional regulator [Flexivirga sp.]|uniref:FadR/GntR family transcriptional regulator n=1 Tax=Flexivirga sp. TaxID=1962927 RepID=UPI003F7F59EC
MSDIRRLSRESSVSVRIAQQIVELIGAGTFGVGAKLPSEMELARQFGVSRPSVREALGALQFAGYVESVRGSGTHVISASGSAGRTEPVVADLSIASALNVFEARLLIEPHVAALAAKHPVTDKIDDAAELVEGMHLVVHEPGLHAATDLRIHRAIAHICPNEVMRSHALHLLDLAASPTLEKVRIEAWKEQLLPSIWGDQHQQVLHAIAAHDPQAAAEATWVHLVSAVLSALDVLAADPAIDEEAVRRVQALAENGPVLPHGEFSRAHSHRRGDGDHA